MTSLERELGINDYMRHRLKRRLAGPLRKDEAAKLRVDLKGLERRRETTLRLLEDLNEQYEERVHRSLEGIRARTSRPPRRLPMRD